MPFIAQAIRGFCPQLPSLAAIVPSTHCRQIKYGKATRKTTGHKTSAFVTEADEDGAVGMVGRTMIDLTGADVGSEVSVDGIRLGAKEFDGR